jgi:myosin heavy chain 9/10/11/14
VYSYKFNIDLHSQRDTMSQFREDSRKIRSDYDELQLRYDDEVWCMEERLEKERLDTKIEDLTKAYETTTADRGSALSSPRASGRVERC